MIEGRWVRMSSGREACVFGVMVFVVIYDHVHVYIYAKCGCIVQWYVCGYIAVHYYACCPVVLM